MSYHLGPANGLISTIPGACQQIYLVFGGHIANSAVQTLSIVALFKPIHQLAGICRQGNRIRTDMSF